MILRPSVQLMARQLGTLLSLPICPLGGGEGSTGRAGGVVYEEGQAVMTLAGLEPASLQK